MCLFAQALLDDGLLVQMRICISVENVAADFLDDLARISADADCLQEGWRCSSYVTTSLCVVVGSDCTRSFVELFIMASGLWAC